MKYFKNENGEVFGLEDTQLELKKDDWVEINKNEMAEMTKKEHPIEIQRTFKISELEFELNARLNAPITIKKIGYKIKSDDFSYFDLLFSENNEIDFICADNSIRKLNKADYNKLKLLQAQRKNELAITFRKLKNEVEKAENSESLKEIQWQ